MSNHVEPQTKTAIHEHRVSGGANCESGCSAMRNGGIGHNVSTAHRVSGANRETATASNGIQDSRVSGWRTA